MEMRQTAIALLLTYAFLIVQAKTYFPCSQISAVLVNPGPSNHSVEAEFKSPDTVFIYRKVTESYYHAVYINEDKESESYKAATDFSFNEWDNKNYHARKSAIEREKPGSFTKRETYDLPQNWLPLYKYKDKYYLYDPSDGQSARTIINSQEFIYWGMEGPAPFPLKLVKKISDTQYTLALLNPFKQFPTPTQVTIHIIDPLTKLAVFEYANQDGFCYYKLCIPAVSASNFDLIVNHCEETRQTEFEFDTIDYAQLLGTPNTR